MNKLILKSTFAIAIIIFNVFLNPLSIIVLANSSEKIIYEETDIANHKLDFCSTMIVQNNEKQIKSQINKEINERVDVCETKISILSTTDSLNDVTEDLIAEKQQKEEKARLEAEAKAKAEAEAKAKAEREEKLAKFREDEIYLLAAIIHCEARGESYEGQVAVGAVVLNRVKSSKFPNTIKDVIYQKGQFSPVSSGTLDRVLLNGNVSSSCLSAAKDAIAGSNPIGNCLYFHRVNGDSGIIIGNHVFKETW